MLTCFVDRCENILKIVYSSEADRGGVLMIDSPTPALLKLNFSNCGEKEPVIAR